MLAAFYIISVQFPSVNLRGAAWKRMFPPPNGSRTKGGIHLSLPRSISLASHMVPKSWEPCLWTDVGLPFSRSQAAPATIFHNSGRNCAVLYKSILIHNTLLNKIFIFFYWWTKVNGCWLPISAFECGLQCKCFQVWWVFFLIPDEFK